MLSGFAAGAAALLTVGAANAATPIQITDDRAAKKKGFDLIYEARDESLPQAVREGLTQVGCVVCVGGVPSSSEGAGGSQRVDWVGGWGAHEGVPACLGCAGCRKHQAREGLNAARQTGSDLPGSVA